MNHTITLPNRKIGTGYPPFIIAELSGNHNGSIERAREIIAAISETGADAIKLQTYTADTMTLRSDRPEFCITDKDSPWVGRTLYDLYEEAHTPWEWHQELFDYANSLGLIAFSTPFDPSAVDFLNALDVPLFKIASFENTDIPLIRKVAQTGKPLIISTGASTVCDMQMAVHTAQNAGAKDIIMLKCTSAYPAPATDANLHTIPHMRELFGVQTGLSDHTTGIGVAIAAVSMGATVIEKHVTLRREDGGVDAAFSLEPHELKSLVQESHRAWEALGVVHYRQTEGDYSAFKRSLYVVQPVKKGERFSEKNIRSIRPSNGLPTRHYDAILQHGVASCDIAAGIPLTWAHIIFPHDRC